MTPIMQTVRGKTGNCFAACVASITGLPLETLPNHFINDDGETEPRWLDRWNEFLERYGLSMAWADVEFSRVPKGYAIAEAEAADYDSNHAVVCLDGKLVHDPLGDDDYQLGRFVRWYVFTVLDAGQLIAKAAGG